MVSEQGRFEGKAAQLSSCCLEFTVWKLFSSSIVDLFSLWIDALSWRPMYLIEEIRFLLQIELNSSDDIGFVHLITSGAHCPGVPYHQDEYVL